VDEIRTKLRGVTHKEPKTGINRQKLIERYVEPGTRLVPKREPKNRHDPNAVGVWLERKRFLRKKRYHLGYLSRSVAKDVGALLANGHEVTVVVSEVTGGTKEKPTCGVNLVIWL